MYNNIYVQAGDIARPTDINAGGYCWAMLFRLQDVLTWPDINPQTGTITDELVLAAGKKFINIYPTESNRYFKEELKAGPAGYYYQVTVSMRIAGSDATISKRLGDFSSNQWGLIVCDRNGEKRLIGNPDCAARFIQNFNSSATGSVRGRDIQFTWQNKQPAPIYENALPAFTANADEDIYRPQDNYPGGYCWAILFKIEDVQVWPQADPATDLISDTMQLKGEAFFVNISPSETNRFYKEELKYGAAGPYYETTVSMRMPGNTVNNILRLGAFSWHQWGLIVKDRNGEKRLIGNADSGAKFIQNYSSGTVEASRGRDLQFTWQNAKTAPLYNNDFPVAQYITTEDGTGITTEQNELLFQ